MDKEKIFIQLAEILEQTFEIPIETIQPESSLYEDLDLDSIDAIDLVVKVQQLTGKKVNPEDFKTARTIKDVVNIVANIL